MNVSTKVAGENYSKCNVVAVRVTIRHYIQKYMYIKILIWRFTYCVFSKIFKIYSSLLWVCTGICGLLSVLVCNVTYNLFHCLCTPYFKIGLPDGRSVTGQTWQSSEKSQLKEKHDNILFLTLWTSFETQNSCRGNTVTFSEQPSPPK